MGVGRRRIVLAGWLAFVLLAGTALAQAPPPGSKAKVAPLEPPAASDAKPIDKQTVDAAKLRDDINETFLRRKITLKLSNGKSHTGEFIVTHFRPKGDGPFPVVVMNHGRAPKEERAKTPRQRYLPVAYYWVRRGFAVIVPTRIGYGELGQAVDPETSVGKCEVANYRQSVANIVAHTRAAVDFAREQPWADAKRVIVMGVSYGGFGAVGASAADIPGILAAINVSGGLGGSPKQRPERPCHSAGIAQEAAEAGGSARVPMLWLYAENDRYWGSKHPRHWHQAYVKAGGKAELHMFPAVDDDGHKLLGAGFTLWRRAIDSYVTRFGFSAPHAPGTHKASGFASIDDASKVPHLNEPGREGYERFLKGDLPRAFALSPGGAWAWRAGATDAVDSVLKQCQQRSKAPCRLYAVDDMVVWKP